MQLPFFRGHNDVEESWISSSKDGRPYCSPSWMMFEYKSLNRRGDVFLSLQYIPECFLEGFLPA